MTQPSPITVSCDPANPVNYLACCGLFDLLSRMEPSAVSFWNIEPPVRFTMQSITSEPDLLRTVLATLCSQKNWNFFPAPAGKQVYLVAAAFQPPNGRPFTVSLDWWYETLTSNGEIAEKSAWKMYAGQQTIEKIVSDMVAAGSSISEIGHAPLSLSELLEITAEMTGRFGFDPRASRNALDVGYSPNDLNLPVMTFPFSELLAMFGLNSFFASRTSTAGKLDSTKGWRARSASRPPGFLYRLWTRPLPATLVRLAAAHPFDPEDKAFFSERVYRKNYSNLTLAKTTEREAEHYA